MAGRRLTLEITTADRQTRAALARLRAAIKRKGN